LFFSFVRFRSSEFITSCLALFTEGVCGRPSLSGYLDEINVPDLDRIEYVYVIELDAQTTTEYHHSCCCVQSALAPFGILEMVYS
jgi:hypothetical protein